MSDLKRKRRRSSDLPNKRLKQSLLNLEPVLMPCSKLKGNSRLQKLVKSARPSELMDSLMSVGRRQQRALSPAVNLPSTFGKRASSASSQSKASPRLSSINLASCFRQIAGLSPIPSDGKKELCVKKLEAHFATGDMPSSYVSDCSSEDALLRTPVVRLALKYNYRPASKVRKLELRDYNGRCLDLHDA
jgi:hypothetical protein